MNIEQCHFTKIKIIRGVSRATPGRNILVQVFKQTLISAFIHDYKIFSRTVYCSIQFKNIKNFILINEVFNALKVCSCISLRERHCEALRKVGGLKIVGG